MNICHSRTTDRCISYEKHGNTPVTQLYPVIKKLTGILNIATIDMRQYLTDQQLTEYTALRRDWVEFAAQISFDHC